MYSYVHSYEVKTMEKDIEKNVRRPKLLKRTLIKATAVAVSTGLLAVGAVAALDNLPGNSSPTPQVAEPDPIVLEIDEADMAENGDTEDEQQEEKKRGFFSYLKIWFYGLLAGIAGFFATKIPWKKIFTKRNLIILLILILLFLFAKYLLPYFADVPWGPENN